MRNFKGFKYISEDVVVHACASVFLDLALELFCQVPVGAECSILGLLLEPWVPVVELVQAVTEADTLSHGHVSDIISLVALCVAAVVQVLQQSEVLLNHRLVLVLHAELRCFGLLSIVDHC